MSDPASDSAVYNTPEEIAGLLEMSRKHEPHMVPVFEAVRARRIQLARSGQDETTSLTKLRASSADDGDLPTLVILRDDSASERGPKKWPLALGALACSARLVLYDGPPAEETYRGFVILAATFDHVLVVECDAARFDEWREVAAYVKVIVCDPWW